MLTYSPKTIFIVGHTTFTSLIRGDPLGTHSSIVVADQLNLIHDKNGNLVSGDGLYREYNEFNQFVRIRNGSTGASPVLEEYVYHPTQERVLIKDRFKDGAVVESVYYLNDEFVRVVNASGTYDTVYIKVDGQLVAQKNPDGSKNFVHGDHLGSTSLVTDALGNAIENTSYSPFGEILAGGSKSRFSYTGQEFDSLIQDFDYHARRYNPKWGQFLQPDTLLPNVYDPQQLNRYSYAKNNPYRYTDNAGKASIDIHFKETFVNYALATLDPALAFQVAANAAEPDLYKYRDVPGVPLLAKSMGLDLQMNVMGDDAHYYYHFGQGSGGLSTVDLQAAYNKALAAGDVTAMGNLEHGLGHDVGSNGILGYHQKEMEKGHNSYNRLDHSINDIIGFRVDKVALNNAQYDRAKNARSLSRTYQLVQVVKRTLQDIGQRISNIFGGSKDENHHTEKGG